MPSVLDAIADRPLNNVLKSLGHLASRARAIEATEFQSAAELMASVPKDEKSKVMRHTLAILWINECRELAKNRNALSVDALTRELGRYATFAAAAAINADLDVMCRVPADGAVLLPTIGRGEVDQPILSMADVSHMAGEGTTIGHGNQVIHVPNEGEPSPEWQSQRKLRAGDFEIDFDDISFPGKKLPDLIRYVEPTIGPVAMWEVARRVDEEEWRIWQTHFEAVWSMINEHMPNYATGISRTVHSIIPIKVGAAEFRMSRSPAPGVIAMTKPRNPTEMLLPLIEEYQRSNFKVLNAIEPLYTHNALTTELCYYVPWYDSPVSFADLFSGLYAQLAALDGWAVLALMGDKHQKVQLDGAGVEVAQRLLRTEALIDRLLDSPFLTPTGQAFAESMKEGFKRRQSEMAKPTENNEKIARLIDQDHRISWRLRNLHPDDFTVDSLAEAFIAKEKCPDTIVVLATNPPKYNEVRGHFVRKRKMLKDMQPLVLSARQKAHITVSPKDADVWVILSLSHAEGDDIARRALVDFPETVRALHRALDTKHGQRVDPLVLARWLHRLKQPIMEY